MRETNGLLTEELEGLQRKLGRQEKMQEALVDLELEKEVSSGCIISPAIRCPVQSTLGISVPRWSRWSAVGMLCLCGG